MSKSAIVSLVVSCVQIALFTLAITSMLIIHYHYPMADNPFGAGYNLLMLGYIIPILLTSLLSIPNFLLLVWEALIARKTHHWDKRVFVTGLVVVIAWAIYIVLATHVQIGSSGA